MSKSRSCSNTLGNDLSALIATQLQELKTKQLEETSCKSQAANISTASQTHLQRQGQEQCEGSSIISTCVVGHGSAPFCTFHTFQHNNRRSLKGWFANEKIKTKHDGHSLGGSSHGNTSCTSVALCVPVGDGHLTQLRARAP